MKGPSRKNMSASVRARLLNLSKSTGQDFQALVLRYTVERFLVRLAASAHRDRFVLKGAMLYVTWQLEDRRGTMDLDLLGTGSPDPPDLADVIGSICAIETEDDGLSFDRKPVVASAIREDAVYDGVRVVVQVHLGNMPVRFQIDVGFGDAVVPAPLLAEFPALLSERGPMVMAYPRETVIAEKLHAIVLLGMANSRMKDYFDLWVLSRTFYFEWGVLRASVESTFRRRQTPLPEGEPIGLSEEFASNESKRLQWAGFVKRQRGAIGPPDLHTALESLRRFLLPVISSDSTSASARETWEPGDGWRTR